jgi:hypothetical protein
MGRGNRIDFLRGLGAGKGIGTGGIRGGWEWKERVIKDMIGQIKTTLRFHLTPVRMPIFFLEWKSHSIRNRKQRSHFILIQEAEKREQKVW